MGTHPIFESDFDCLTEMFRKRLIRVRRLPLPVTADSLSCRPLSICPYLHKNDPLETNRDRIRSQKLSQKVRIEDRINNLHFKDKFVETKENVSTKLHHFEDRAKIQYQEKKALSRLQRERIKEKSAQNVE